jgi:hypothetical protein
MAKRMKGDELNNKRHWRMGLEVKRKAKSDVKKSQGLASFQAFDAHLNNLRISPGPVLGAFVSFHLDSF